LGNADRGIVITLNGRGNVRIADVIQPRMRRYHMVALNFYLYGDQAAGTVAHETPLCLFLPAGTLAWFKGWLFFVVTVASSILITFYLKRVNPDVVDARSYPATPIEDNLTPNHDARIDPLAETPFG